MLSSQSPASLQLRYLQTLLELGGTRTPRSSSPPPMDIVGPLPAAGAFGRRLRRWTRRARHGAESARGLVRWGQGAHSW